ncbi:F-box/FBD/LRR-repeat protein At1g13570-like isoform X1 [Cornus florida]|uniref:F-box/FBD/LRR-repeat protein At1g13570-like isoform X1 n=1 Tax=Cornus florida TaxID=4283 RepID=UPI00289DA047|nr:F-box/FBD/LRR-repeat protein At1g13570-like isoform X1 [Cornus florida]
MDTFQEKIRKCPPTDRISKLPRNLIETILMLLPLRDAVRTSILSKKWRYNWAKITQLVFDKTLIIQDPKENLQSLQRKLLTAINQVLLLHDGPILKFTLSFSQLKSSSEIDQFILLLSRNGIEECTFYISKNPPYTLPSSFFSCSQLKHLNLSNCEFVTTLTFSGFSRLVSLELNQVNIGESIGSLVSSCPLLERLTLIGTTHFEYIEIDSPNLKFLKTNVTFGYVHFKNTPLLAVVSINSYASDNFEHLNEKEATEMIKVFGCLPVIETLEFGRRFVKFLTVANVPERLPFTLDHLKILELNTLCLGEIADVSFALCLIKSSPNLKNFAMEVFPSDDATRPTDLEFLEMQDYSNVSLN